jgi:tetratricopeptide (TPR) repeat protein
MSCAIVPIRYVHFFHGEAMKARKAAAPVPAPQPKIRLNQRDLDSSCYRLSRVPQKFAMSKAVKAEPTESFATTYYSQNPLDTRTPQEKLADVESRLTEGPADEDEKFTLLVQKKTLTQMIYGEASPETIRATTVLGAFYNEHNKPDSAARNLTKASGNAKQTELQQEDLFELAVELADANLNATAQNKLDKAKQVAIADATLTPYAEYESENKLSCFKRDLYLGRIRSFRMHWNEALAFYEKALAAYPAVHQDEQQPGGDGEEKEKFPEEANICVEAAQVAERIDGCDKAPGLYRRAYDLYLELGYDEDAERLEGKIGDAPPTQKNEKEEAGKIDVVGDVAPDVVGDVAQDVAENL